VAGDQRPLAVAGGKPVAGVTKADGAIEEIVVRLQTVVSHQSTVISQGKNWSEDGEDGGSEKYSVAFHGKGASARMGSVWVHPAVLSKECASDWKDERYILLLAKSVKE